MTEKGLLVVVSGFSGAGKGSIMKRILQKYDNYALSISATTRDPRPGEMDGQDYFYKTQKQFEKMIDKDELIEYASYQGNYYGTPKAYVEKQLNSGKDVILEIEVQGATKVKELLPDTVLIFVTPPSARRIRSAEDFAARSSKPNICLLMITFLSTMTSRQLSPSWMKSFGQSTRRAKKAALL